MLNELIKRFKKSLVAVGKYDPIAAFLIWRMAKAKPKPKPKCCP